MNCDVLVIGGGGGGGGGYGGGGGGGGCINYQQNFLFNNGTYEIIVGKGGNGGVGYNANTMNSPLLNGLSGGISSIKSNGILISSAQGGEGGEI